MRCVVRGTHEKLFLVTHISIRYLEWDGTGIDAVGQAKQFLQGSEMKLSES